MFPEPGGNVEEIEGVKTITLAKLIELKLASGMTAPDRLRDLADVQELIKVKGLTEEYANEIDESVRAKYRELHRGVELARSRERGGQP